MDSLAPKTKKQRQEGTTTSSASSKPVRPCPWLSLKPSTDSVSDLPASVTSGSSRRTTTTTTSTATTSTTCRAAAPPAGCDVIEPCLSKVSTSFAEEEDSQLAGDPLSHTSLAASSPLTAAHASGIRRAVVLDIETTGFGPTDEIIEVAAWELWDGEFTGCCFYSIVSTSKAMHPAAAEKNRLTSEEVQEGQPPSSVFTRLAAFLGSPVTTILVAHNAKFDLPMLSGCMKRHSPNVEPQFSGFLTANKHCCTMKLFRQLFPKQPFSLAQSAGFMGLVVNKSRLHGALEDARLTGLLYQRLAAIVFDAIEGENDAGEGVVDYDYHDALEEEEEEGHGEHEDDAGLDAVVSGDAIDGGDETTERRNPEPPL